MNEKTKRFVRSRFKEYYKRVRIEPPRDFWMREWGFVLFDQYFPAKLVMRRHISFTTRDDVMNYLRENAPAHAYYSTAIYKYPAADMAKKGWLGADLIFDLDADHIVSEAELPRYSYEDLLKLVKKETLKLIDFLITDFGFSGDDIKLAFSGSRGYHVHINTEAVRGLGSRERREIIDYLSRGPDVDLFLVEKRIDYDGEELRRCPYCNKITRSKICPICRRDTLSLGGRGDLRLLTHGAWGKRLLRGLIDLLRGVAEMEEEEAITALKKICGVGEQRARDLIGVAKDENSMKRIEEGKLGQISGFPQSVWQSIIESVRVRIESDAPVTADIKRLIRLPGSLHGRSSLKTEPLTIETFKEFDPLEDAVVFGDSPVEIIALRDSAIKLRGNSYKVKEGEITSLPEHVALYLICRGAAEIK
ncbi:MAG: DNA primase small subunit domain-containing protein [Candidatus Methanospirareceae archaeon]